MLFTLLMGRQLLGPTFIGSFLPSIRILSCFASGVSSGIAEQLWTRTTNWTHYIEKLRPICNNLRKGILLFTYEYLSRVLKKSQCHPVKKLKWVQTIWDIHGAFSRMTEHFFFFFHEGAFAQRGFPHNCRPTSVGYPGKFPQDVCTATKDEGNPLFLSTFPRDIASGIPTWTGRKMKPRKGKTSMALHKQTLKVSLPAKPNWVHAYQQRHDDGNVCIKMRGACRDVKWTGPAASQRSAAWHGWLGTARLACQARGSTLTRHVRPIWHGPIGLPSTWADPYGPLGTTLLARPKMTIF